MVKFAHIVCVYVSVVVDFSWHNLKFLKKRVSTRDFFKLGWPVEMVLVNIIAVERPKPLKVASFSRLEDTNCITTKKLNCIKKQQENCRNYICACVCINNICVCICSHKYTRMYTHYVICSHQRKYYLYSHNVLNIKILNTMQEIYWIII